jgi:hypothetical protein
MMDALKALFKQPGWVIVLVCGVVLVAFPCVSVDKDYHWKPQPPSTIWPVACGVTLLAVSVLVLGYSSWTKYKSEEAGTGLDVTLVKEKDGVMWTSVSGCEIRVTEGRIQDYAASAKTVVVLPCNEYFDDRCAGHTLTALGAYVNRVYEGQVESFISLMQAESQRKLGPGQMQQKTNDEQAVSFGAGRCVLLTNPLGRSNPVALVSTTTQRAGQGLAARISYQFDGMRELVGRLADARLTDVAMPIMGAGHGRIDPPLAFVGLVLAVAEAARYGQGGQRLRRVTIVVFKKDVNAPAEVEHAVVRRALALIGDHD